MSFKATSIGCPLDICIAGFNQHAGSHMTGTPRTARLVFCLCAPSTRGIKWPNNSSISRFLVPVPADPVMRGFLDIMPCSKD